MRDTLRYKCQEAIGEKMAERMSEESLVLVHVHVRIFIKAFLGPLV